PRIALNHRQFRWSSSIYLDTTRVRERPYYAYRFAHQRTEIHGLDGEAQLPRDDSAAIENVIDDLRHCPNVALHRLQRVALQIVAAVPLHELHPAENRVQGAPQLVSEHRKKIVGGR